MPIRIYHSGIQADRQGASGGAFASSGNVSRDASCVEPNKTKENKNNAKRRGGSKVKKRPEERWSSTAGQRADFWKPYKPLGNMGSVLNLKVSEVLLFYGAEAPRSLARQFFCQVLCKALLVHSLALGIALLTTSQVVLVRESHLTGEQKRTYLGKGAKKHFEEEEEGKGGNGEGNSDGDNEIVEIRPGVFRPKKPRSKKGSGTKSRRRSLNRVLNISRSPAFKYIQNRVKEGQNIAKFVAAGTSIESHLKAKTAEECVNFAIEHCRSGSSQDDATSSLFSLLSRYDHVGLSHQLMQSESNASLMSNDNGHSSPMSSDRSGTFTTQIVQIKQGVERGGGAMSPSQSSKAGKSPTTMQSRKESLRVSENLEKLLTPDGVADDLSEAGAGGPGSPRSEERGGGAGMRVRRSSRARMLLHGGINNIGEPGKLLEIHPERAAASDNMFTTVSNIFKTRLELEKALKRKLDESAFNWSQMMLDRSRLFSEEPPKDIRTTMARFNSAHYDQRERNSSLDVVDDASYGSDTSTDSEDRVEILLTPRIFKSPGQEMSINKERAVKDRESLVSARIQRNPWLLEALKVTQDSLKGMDPPACVVEFLSAIKQIVIFGFDLDQGLMFKLMEEVMEGSDHKIPACQHMIRRVREHVGITAEAYLQWLKDKGIQPPANLIREVKRRLYRKKAGQRGRQGRRGGGNNSSYKKRMGKFQMSPSLATLGEIDDEVISDPNSFSFDGRSRNESYTSDHGSVSGSVRGDTGTFGMRTYNSHAALKVGGGGGGGGGGSLARDDLLTERLEVESLDLAESEIGSLASYGGVSFKSKIGTTTTTQLNTKSSNKDFVRENMSQVSGVRRGSKSVKNGRRSSYRGLSLVGGGLEGAM